MGQETLADLTYILVTPVKNEEANIPELIQSITSQHVRPVGWFIVDDNSDDQTPGIIDKATAENSWIHSMRLVEGRAYDLEEHYASICRAGFNWALNYCKDSNVEFEYIALSDADMVYPGCYFYQVICFLRRNPEFGIVGGKVLIRNERGSIREETKTYPTSQPAGTGRVWRRECFIQTGGYMQVLSPDAVSNVMALLGGWKVKQLSDVECYQTRSSGGRYSLWSGYFSQGKRAYYMNLNLLGVLVTVIDMVLVSRPGKSLVRSLAFFSGYFWSLIRREDQIEIAEVRKYMGDYKGTFNRCWLAMKELIKRK